MEEGFKSCGSTIIHSQWLLTAAHCLFNFFRPIVPNAPVWVVLGVDDVTDTENMPKKDNKLPRVDLTHCHPNYSHTLVGPPEIGQRELSVNDICMLRVDHDIEFGTYINKATLPWTAYDKVITDNQLLISGYGGSRVQYNFSDWDLVPSDKLLSTRLKLLDNKECVLLFRDPDPRYPDTYDPTYEFCAKSPDEVIRSGCLGDSGGGGIYTDSITGCPVIVGVLVAGSSGDCDGATQFVSVSFYRDWIEQTIERFSRPRDGSGIEYTYPERNKLD